MFSPDLAPDAPWDLLARHLTGEASPAEQAELRAWVAARPENQAVLAEATRAWDQAATEPALAFAAADVDRAWQRFETQSLPPKVDVGQAGRPAGRVVSMWGRTAVWRAAAAAVVVLGGGWWALRERGTTRTDAGPPVVAQAREAKREVLLPDGSRVWLNRHSELRYAAGYGPQNRVVELTGEAFFEVTKQHGQSFTVLTPTTRTRVLGTSFNVRAYPAEDSVEVAVATGRVAFAARTAGGDSVVLRPAQRGVWRKAEPGPHLATTADANFRAWQRDELVFDNARLDYVARTLEAAFDTRIVVPDEALRSCRFTGTFRKPQLEAVLRVVSVATSATLGQQSDGSWTLRGNGCAPPQL